MARVLHGPGRHPSGYRNPAGSPSLVPRSSIAPLSVAPKGCFWRPSCSPPSIAYTLPDARAKDPPTTTEPCSAAFGASPPEARKSNDSDRVNKKENAGGPVPHRQGELPIKAHPQAGGFPRTEGSATDISKSADQPSRNGNTLDSM